MPPNDQPGIHSYGASHCCWPPWDDRTAFHLFNLGF